MDIVSACRAAGVYDNTLYRWRNRYCGMGRAKLKQFEASEKENQNLKKILAELDLEKSILKELKLIPQWQTGHWVVFGIQPPASSGLNFLPQTLAHAA